MTEELNLDPVEATPLVSLPMQVLAMYAPNGVIVQAMRLPPEADPTELLHGELRIIDVGADVLANPNAWRVDLSGPAPVVVAREAIDPHAGLWRTVDMLTGTKAEIDRADILADVSTWVGQEMSRRSLLPVDVDGVKFDADAKAQKNIQAKITEIAALQRLGQEIDSNLLVWRDYNNVTHTFESMADLDTVLSKVVAAIAHRGTVLYVWSWQVKQRCSELATVEDIVQFLEAQGVATR